VAVSSTLRRQAVLSTSGFRFFQPTARRQPLGASSADAR
jgi:hypothetical protein